MIASLGMYDMPPIRPCNDRFWRAIRARLGRGPECLTWDRDLWTIWRAPDLVLAQTCGMPYRTALHGEVALVGTPDYGLPDCPPGHYRSVFLTRKTMGDRSLADLATGVFAYNDAFSQSGWAAPMHHLGARAQCGGGRGDADRLAHDRVPVLLGQSRTRAEGRARAAHAGALREHEDDVRPDRLDLLADAATRARAERGHRDHGRDADEHPEDRERGAQRAASDRLEREAHAVPGRRQHPSTLSASIGSSCDARRAGKNPNPTPTNALVANATSTAS